MRIRLAVMAIGLLGTVSALALVPRGRSWFSTLGSATLVVYLFHGFVVRYADAAGWLDWSAAQPDLALAGVAVGSTALALLLATPPVCRRLGALVDPVGRWQARSLAWRDGARPLAGQREDGAGDGGRHRTLVDHGAR
jgi:fucose 4-O-acetylase-like acetyltransferase